MVPESKIRDRLVSLQKLNWWSPWIWKPILFGIPVILLWGVLGVFVPVIRAEVEYQARSTKQNFEAIFPAGIKPNLSWVALPNWVGRYALEIPKLGVREQVIEGVDTTDEVAYTEALKGGVAHAKGTGLPGKGGVQYYFAHSSGLPFWGDRAVVFALLNKLELGDEVYVYWENKKYVYKVIDKQVVSREEVSWLFSTEAQERVVLQTCWPIGTNWKRLLVIAEPLNQDVSGVDRGRGFGKISLAMKRMK